MGEAPRRLAAIDVGSYAIRLRVVELEAGARRVLAQPRFDVRLGLATYGAGRLDDASIEAAVVALADCARTCAGFHVAHTRAVATAALRDAPNADVLVDRVRAETGIALEIIKGPEEAHLLFLGLEAAARAAGPVALVELGSGSLQIAAGAGARTAFTASLPLGGVRLAIEHATSATLAEAVRTELEAPCEAVRALAPRKLYAAGGFRELSAIAGLDPAAPGPFARDDLTALFRRRAAVGTVGGATATACVAATLVELLDMPALELVDTNLRDGVLAALSAEARG